LKFNVDGSSKGKPGDAGIGGVLRNEHGSILCVFSDFIGSFDSNAAELFAIKEALAVFVSKESLRSFNLLIESDSQVVISWVSKREGVP
jgi:ribonuclease HI